MGNIRDFFGRHHLRRRSTSHPSPSPSPAPTSADHPHTRHRQLTPLEELERVFTKFDGDGDGKISSSELSALFSTLGETPTPSELGSMMAEADSDGDGFISLAEFLDLNTRGVEPDDALEDIRRAFSVFDLDRNGKISVDELMKVMRSLGEGATVAECRKMIGGVDRDGDGLISFEEFKAMMEAGSSFLAVSSSSGNIQG